MATYSVCVEFIVESESNEEAREKVNTFIHEYLDDETSPENLHIVNYYIIEDSEVEITKLDL